MWIGRVVVYLLEFLLISMCFSCLRSTEQPLSNRLIRILTALQPFRPEFCQFKFENCIQDSSYADQFDTDCNIYSRLRDCYRSLLDESQCVSRQLKRQYQQAKQNEYDSCALPSSYQSVRSSIYTSSATRLKLLSSSNYFLFFVTLSFSAI